MSRSSQAAGSRQAPLKLPDDGSGPRYHQLKTAIRERVESGHWPVGYRLPTMRQLSADLGVAYATVERAVRELAEEGLLEGRKRGGTRVAQSRPTRQNTVGILGTMPYDRLKSQSMYGLKLSNLLQEQILARQCTVVYDHWRENLPLREHFNHMQLVDGVILFGQWSGSKQFKEVENLHRSGRPLVHIGETLADSPITTINSADAQDSFRAVCQLIEQGHERIVMLGHPFSARTTTFLARLEGFKAAMARTARGFSGELVIVDETQAIARHMATMKPRPTAAFVPIVRSFPELYEQLRGTPLQPGQGMAVAVYDENLWHKVESFSIPFISVEQPMEAIARRAVETLLAMRDDPQFRPGHIEIPSLIYQVQRDGRRQLLAG